MSGSARLRYQPALDGLRAVALLGVIAYHAGIDVFHGGFLGVSTFFTLSGFLITSLLLTERESSGTVNLGSFWTRRVRRLLPAAIVTILFTLVVAAALGDDSQLARLRADSLASLLHFSNWRFIVGGDNYGALFESPSFFRHFWSLAVEEQYYLVFPLLVTLGLRATRGPNRVFTGVLAAIAAAGIAWPAILLAGGASTNRLYFGTDTRLAELVLGALLAVWWVRRGRVVPDRPVPLTLAAIGATAVMATMWVNAAPSDTYLYRGGLAVHALLTLVVIVAAIAPRGPVRALLSWSPLRQLGVISYGMYLFHWPILLVLQQETSLGPEQRFVVGFVLSVAVATLSHRLVEQPIRRSTAGPRFTWLVVPASVTAASAILVVTMIQTPAEAPIDFARAQRVLAELTVAPTEVAAAATTTTHAVEVAAAVEVASPAPLRVSGFGDSTALMTGMGVAFWARDHPDQLTMVQGQAKLGCGLATGGNRILEGRVMPVPDDCDPWLQEWVASIEGHEVDVAMVQLGAWDIVDYQPSEGGPYLAIGRDDKYEAQLRDALENAIATLHEHSDLVVLLAHPDVGQARLDGVPAGISYPEYEPARAERWREILRATAAADPRVEVIDLAAWLDTRTDDAWLRPDGVHFSYESTTAVAEWLAPEIIETHARWQASFTEATS